jgi:nitrile hydratase accessory protein
MAERDGTAVLAWDGPWSPPRRNGELVFESVWQSRLFGMTMALYESGAFRWEEFRDQLIAAIARWEQAHPPDAGGFRYWDCWLEAFEHLMAAKDICGDDTLAERVRQLAARPHGHDH